MIREMFPEEVEDAVDLYMSYAPERAKERGMTEEEYLKSSDAIRKSLLDRDTVLLSERFGKILGLVAFHVCANKGDRYGIVEVLCVSRERANKLLGFRLMKAMEGLLISERCTRLVARPYKKQKMWHRMLPKYGFKEYAHNNERTFFFKSLYKTEDN